MASSRSEELFDLGLSNISLVVEEGLCTGCGTCVGLCPEDCITIESNYVLGSREPVVDQEKCVKCGVCQAHCPTYQVNKEEGSVARGKIALAAALIDNETGLEDRLQEDMSMCLMCGSCVNKCPNKVPTNEIVGAIRREITDNQGLSFIGKGVSTLLSQKILMKTLGKGGALLSPLILKKIPESSGLRLRFPSPVMKERTIPKVPFKNLFERVIFFFMFIFSFNASIQ